VLRPEQLAAAMFPLGVSTKAEVRAEAARRGLPVAAKPDSHDICFVPSGDTAGWLRQRLGEQPGDIVDETGAVVGSHEGAYAFTVGQRRGLGLQHPAADGRPRYVLSVSPVDRTVTVGPQKMLAVSRIECGPAVWCGDAPAAEFTALAQVRAHGSPVACAGRVEAGGLTVTVEPELAGVAAGQTLVLYDGDRVVGSATIERAA
jgi:tRNA-specific 2-thiouridylase